MNVVIERTSTPITGSEWLDHYQLLRLLKNGGMSKVYLAYDTYTHRHIAIKVMERGHFNEEFFLSEVRLMRSLNHPNESTSTVCGLQQGVTFFMRCRLTSCKPTKDLQHSSSERE